MLQLTTPRKNVVQPRLEIGRPDDKYEKEADAVSDRVMRMPSSENLQMKSAESKQDIQMKFAQSKEEEQLQMKTAENTGNILRMRSAGDERKKMAPEGITRQLMNPSNSGSPLPKSVQYEMGSKMGADFSGVKVHTNNTAVQLSQDLGAKAFTVGNNVYFNKGQYNPQISEGKGLLAHELMHVAQQGAEIKRTIIQCNQELPDPTFVEPRAIYLIRESVHRVPGLPSIPHTGGQLGPFLIKVQRSVIQLHAVWQPEGGTPSTWQVIKDRFGIEQIRREYTGEHRWVVVYSGFRNIVQARGGVELFDAPSLGLFRLGSDPIPHIQLYGNQNVQFTTAGGREDPSAAALYDGSNNQMEVIQIDELPEVQEEAMTLPGASQEPGPSITTP